MRAISFLIIILFTVHFAGYDTTVESIRQEDGGYVALSRLEPVEKSSYPVWIFDDERYEIYDTISRFEYCGDTVKIYKDTCLKSWYVKDTLAIGKKTSNVVTLTNDGYVTVRQFRFKRKCIVVLDSVNRAPRRTKMYYSDREYKNKIRSYSVTRWNILDGGKYKKDHEIVEATYFYDEITKVSKTLNNTFEYIFVNDGSSDNPIKVIKDYVNIKN